MHGLADRPTGESTTAAKVRTSPPMKREDTMTITVTLPPTHQPYLEEGQLPADFYNYEELLSDSEREKIHRIRDFFRTEVTPIVNEYWARAEFPFELVKGFANLG